MVERILDWKKESLEVKPVNKGFKFFFEKL